MSKPYVEQVGGTHYNAPVQGEQHWDLIEEFDISYLEGNATKYIIRYDLKGKPKEDLLKAKSYLLRAIAEGRGPRRFIPNDRLHRFLTANDASPFKVSLFRMILSSDGNLQMVGLKMACDVIDNELARMERDDVTA